MKKLLFITTLILGSVSIAYAATAPAINSLLSWNGTIFTSTTSPTVGYVIATSSTASQFPYASSTATSASTFCIGTSCISVWPNGGGGGGSGNVGTSSVPVIGNLAYWTTTTATPALLGTVATTSIGCTGLISCTGFYALGTASTISYTGNNWATTSTNYWLTQQNLTGFSTTSANYWSSQGLGFSTTSSAYWISTYPNGNLFSTTSSNYWLAQNTGNAFSTTSAAFWQTQNNFFSTTSSAYWLTQNTGNAFSTTSANYWGGTSGAQGLTFSTTSTDYWLTQKSLTAASSTLLANNNTFSGVDLFTNASSNFGGTWQTLSPSAFDTFAWPFAANTNFATAVVSTSTIAWFTKGLQASTTSQFDYASTTMITATTASTSKLIVSGSVIISTTTDSGNHLEIYSNDSANQLSIDGWNDPAMSFSLRDIVGGYIGEVGTAGDFFNGSFTKDLAIRAESGNIDFGFNQGTLKTTALTLASSTLYVGIGTSTPYAPLSVVGKGGVVAENFTATSTATSTFTGPVVIGSGTTGTSTMTIGVAGLKEGCINFVTFNGTTWATSSMYMEGASAITEANACK